MDSAEEGNAASTQRCLPHKRHQCHRRRPAPTLELKPFDAATVWRNQ
jgi:hypothetical protein